MRVNQISLVIILFRRNELICRRRARHACYANQTRVSARKIFTSLGLRRQRLKMRREIKADYNSTFVIVLKLQLNSHPSSEYDTKNPSPPSYCGTLSVSMRVPKVVTLYCL